jgi:hypothetical protein
VDLPDEMISSILFYFISFLPNNEKMGAKRALKYFVSEEVISIRLALASLYIFVQKCRFWKLKILF